MGYGWPRKYFNTKIFRTKFSHMKIFQITVYHQINFIVIKLLLAPRCVTTMFWSEVDICNISSIKPIRYHYSSWLWYSNNWWHTLLHHWWYSGKLLSVLLTLRVLWVCWIWNLVESNVAHVCALTLYLQVHTIFKTHWPHLLHICGVYICHQLNSTRVCTDTRWTQSIYPQHNTTTTWRWGCE